MVLNINYQLSRLGHRRK